MGLFERIVSVSCQIPFLTRKLHFSEQELMGSLRMTKDGKHRDLNHPKSWIIYLWPIFTHPCWHIIAVFDIALTMSPWFPTQSTNTRGFLLIGHSAEIGLFPTTPPQFFQLSWKCINTSSYTPNAINSKAGTPKLEHLEAIPAVLRWLYHMRLPAKCPKSVDKAGASFALEICLTRMEVNPSTVNYDHSRSFHIIGPFSLELPQTRWGYCIVRPSRRASLRSSRPF